MKAIPHRCYEFESFRIDAAGRRLWREDQVLPLTSKTFDILLALVENSGRTINKDELMERVWADTFVEEGNLNRNICTLRKVLGDDGHKQRFIRTIPKQGYRFTAPVREIDAHDSLFVEKTSSVSLKVWEETLETSPGGMRKFALRVAAAAALILIGTLVSAWMLSGSTGASIGVRAGTQSTEAVEAFQKGRELWQTRSATDLYEATVLVEKAVRVEPDFALAHSALADAYAFDYRFWPKAEATAREAIRLDPNLGEPHATIGFVKMFWEQNLADAETELKKAVDLSPNYATGHQWYAINLMTTGSAGSGALAEMKRALELEPNSLSINADLCQVLYYLNRYDEAAEQCRATLALDPRFYNAYFNLYEIYGSAGKYDEAIEAYLAYEELNPMPPAPGVRESLLKAYETGGIRAFWQARLKHLPTHYRKAQHHARLGNNAEAINSLRKAHAAREFEFVQMNADPVFRELKQDSRFLELRNTLYYTGN